ncbi:hypothetical protein [Streptomyces sp. XD-27]|uniref:hypothetical protein n=1 Tax=Streptomyces sp. XD-27 TaxID=3062779 RepID=UPI0026F478A8|nr:hypothetical protein [Streptomyces sp. XD-27]WKX69783.1 hypothetical protein Q3Y56_07540 [Streptomyces sp. XD-27]
MTEILLNLVLGLVTAAMGTGFGWFSRTFLYRRELRRTQRFFGLPPGAECLLVVNRDFGGAADSVARNDTYALLELAGLVKECGAGFEVAAHDETRQGIGERTEFCVGGPRSNRRMAAHLAVSLPGFSIEGEVDFAVAGTSYRMERGAAEYVLLARVAPGAGRHPLFLLCGQRSVANQAAARYLAREHPRLARTHGVDGVFCLLLKVVNSEAYGPDAVEVVADVSGAAVRTSPGGRTG